jgi:menaquinone-specific isochorismate synthase
MTPKKVNWIGGRTNLGLCTDLYCVGEFHICAGFGMVAGSNPRKELEESAAKMIPMRSALQPLL